jgi:transposase
VVAVNPPRPTREQLITLAKEDPEAIADLVLSLLDRIDKLESRIATLELNSRNSSKPPSSDKGNFTNSPKPKPKSLRKKTTKKRGGQRGHKGNTLEKSDCPDFIIEHQLPKSLSCKNCDHVIDVHVTNHQSRQVFDIPPIKMQVTEHRAQQCQCPHCDASITAEFPPEVTAPVQYGSSLQAVCIYLSSYQLLPYKRLSETFSDLFNIPLSQGTIANIIKSVGVKAAVAVQPIYNALSKADVMHCDETGCRLNAKRHWLHVASNSHHTYYHIDEKRGIVALENIGLLKDYEGNLIHDCLGAYNHYTKCKHGICNAHITRELVYVEEQIKQPWSTYMKELLLESKRQTEIDGFEITQELKTATNKRYLEILSEGLIDNPEPEKLPGKRGRPKRSKTLNLLLRMGKQHRGILSFYNREGVPFDNNQAERDIRMMKTREKISGGFGNKNRAKNFCDLRSIISTSLKQGQNILQILTELIANPLLAGYKLARLPE